MVENGKVVKVHYTGKFEDGEVFDSSEGRDPLTFVVGANSVISGFENAILGKNVGDKVSTTIQPSEGYGEVREDLFVNVSKDKMPGEVYAGQILEVNDEQGQTSNVIVKEVNENDVVIDFNAPLAGKVIEFEIEVVEIN